LIHADHHKTQTSNTTTFTSTLPTVNFSIKPTIHFTFLPCSSHLMANTSSWLVKTICAYGAFQLSHSSTKWKFHEVGWLRHSASALMAKFCGWWQRMWSWISVVCFCSRLTSPCLNPRQVPRFSSIRT
jgi:hypothetical protein